MHESMHVSKLSVVDACTVLAVYQRAYENTLLRAHSLGREAMMYAHVQMVICGCVSLEAYKYIYGLSICRY
jgi:hypothetical protein